MMELHLPPFFSVDSDVAQALRHKQPVVALESTVITHGLPYPTNLRLAHDMESEVRRQGAVPATIALVAGHVRVGVSAAELEPLAHGENVHKISSRDFAPAIALGWNGGTTVAGTLLAAERTGIRVFATGGIGGVHRLFPGAQPSASLDISADLPQLARSPVIVVCAGAKAILDLPATLEYLETAGIPVVGFQTSEFPAFYSRTSGLKASAQADTPAQIAAIARAHWQMGMPGAVLVVNPPPEEVALPVDLVESAITQAVQDLVQQGIHGQQVTPFLLARLSELTHGESLKANLGLLRNNAQLAAQVAVELSRIEAESNALRI